MRRDESQDIPDFGRQPPRHWSLPHVVPPARLLTYFESLVSEKQWLEARAKFVEARMKDVRDVMFQWTEDEWRSLGLCIGAEEPDWEEGAQ